MLTKIRQNSGNLKRFPRKKFEKIWFKIAISGDLKGIGFFFRVSGQFLVHASKNMAGLVLKYY